MKTNSKVKFTETTHEGANSSRINTEQQLRRSVMSCMLFEDEFYEDGVSISERINGLVKQLPFEKVAAIAIEAREKMKLRHVPLWITCGLIKARHGGRKMGDLIANVCQRADEPAELLSMYWKDQPGAPLPAQLKIGLARALGKFNEYNLAKYNRDESVKLRDVLFLSHAKPKDEAQEALFKKIANNTLSTPDTWEVALSSGKDKKITFERLIEENQLGALAFLRNLRNMEQVGIDKSIIANYGNKTKFSKVLPFRFISAARAVPQWEDIIEPWMLKALEESAKLYGKTVIIVDNSGSMNNKLSAKSDLSRSDAACALAILVKEICEDSIVIGYGNDAAIIANRRGFALADDIKRGPGGGTDTRKAVNLANSKGYDRIIVITDEQSHTFIGPPQGKGYVINVANFKNGIGYGPWTHIDGWSEAIIEYIRAAETGDN